MKSEFFKGLMVSAAVLATAPLAGAAPPSESVAASTNSFSNIPLETARPPARNRIGVSYRTGLNMTADFKKLGGYGPLTDPGPATGSAENRTYDNGYNLVDSSGNNHGGFIGTWYWGYQDANSVQGDNLILQSSSSPANAVSEDRSDGAQHGVELSYSREFRRGERWRCGIEGAVGYMPLCIEDSRTLRNREDVLTDSFSLGGVQVPDAPYAGTFEGPGPVIGSSPVRNTSVVSDGATISGRRTMDADIFSLRLGPYVEFPIGERFMVGFSGGLTLIAGETDFSFREMVVLDSGGAVSRSGGGSQTDFLAGGYIGGTISCALTEEVSLFAGAHYQAAGRAVNKSDGKEAVLNLNKSVILMFGVSYSF